MAKMYTVVSPGGEETVSLKTGEAVCKKENSEMISPGTQKVHIKQIAIRPFLNAANRFMLENGSRENSQAMALKEIAAATSGRAAG